MRRVSLLLLLLSSPSLAQFQFRHHFVDRDLPGASYGQTSFADIDNDGGRNHALFLENLARSPSINWTRQTLNPGGSNQQTGALVADFDKDGATDIVIAHRVHAPALVWMRFDGKTWQRQVIDPDFLTVEAGGAAHDIDGDGDLDIVFGGDGQSRQIWWWENPYPNFTGPWKRRFIKNDGANQHHDQVFADFLGEGKPQLVFWNQRAKSLMLARIPADPRVTGPWPYEPIFSGQAGEGVAAAAQYAEGVDSFDIDGDGRIDPIAGNHWFHFRDGKFHPVKVGAIGGRIRAGHFRPSKTAQIVIAPGDGSGPLIFYSCDGDPRQPACWQPRNLLPRDMVHGHTLELGDINADGHLDIFAAEMAKWTRSPEPRDHNDATAWILYGDGSGNFRATTLVSGDGWHEGKLADVDGDGDLDIVNKPYTWQAPRLDIWFNARSAGSSPPPRR
ncbi:MAG: VCBS repeat-containing protein [Acidimicrobiia bacterium]|nr:VCBS repeat-containing protein [Acidimicrobiia bacterium]